MKKVQGKYTVWVGGVEVNDYPLTITEAKILAGIYEEEGYEDVIIQKTANLY